MIGRQTRFVPALFIHNWEIAMQELNIDPVALEQFAAYLAANKDAQDATKVSMVAHNSNNDSIGA